MKKIQLFAALTKIDELRREVWGLATAEVVDKDDEIFDYASSKPYFEAWSREIASATSGKSLGNVREMHQSSAVGKLVDLQFDDEQKTIAVGARIVDDAAWEKCVEGVYTGFSIGGRYVKLWPDGDCMRFTAQPVEISVVDNPAVPNAHFTAIKRDGSVEVRFCHSESAQAEEESLPDRDRRLAIGIPHPPRRTRNDKSKQGEAMKPEQEEKLDKALAQSSNSLEKVQAVDSKLESLENGLKELADAFRQFTEGFAKSFGESKRVARTSVAVSKEEDGRGKGASETAGIHGIRGDADPGFLEAMKAAHANPFRAAGR